LPSDVWLEMPSLLPRSEMGSDEPSSRTDDMLKTGGRRLPVRYEARATRMFGAYAVWVSYADGTHEPVLHGTPMHCVKEADRLNGELVTRALRSARAVVA
jgi:hypothetical protein